MSATSVRSKLQGIVLGPESRNSLHLKRRSWSVRVSRSVNLETTIKVYLISESMGTCLNFTQQIGVLV